MSAFPYDIPLTTALPTLPDQEELLKSFKELFESRILSNRGAQILRFEKEIAKYLGGHLHVATCANATLGAELVFRALGLKGKVLVTPFTFVATVHSIVNVGLEPIFVDIDPETYCISPSEIEKHLSKEVCAAFPVHVYGNICDLDYFENLRTRGIKVIYDSAHVFGVKKDKKVVAGWGDAEIYSFHATKILNAAEGGAVVSRNPELVHKIIQMTNFGFTGETSIDMIGTNAKMSELHALLGIASLGIMDEAIRARTQVVSLYKKHLADIPAIKMLKEQAGVDTNGQYFPIFLPNMKARDDLYEFLKEQKIFSRKYFYPLVNHFAPYANKYNVKMPVAESAAERVLCLPIHNLLTPAHVEFIIEQIQKFFRSK